MEDKRALKYFENMPYGDNAKSSEIHGPANQKIINDMVEGLVSEYDQAMMLGDKSGALRYDKAIKKIAFDLDQLREIKKEFATYYGGGTGGKKLFSNYTNLKEFDIPFWLEGGLITFDETLNMQLSVPDANDPKKQIIKRIQDITEDWVVKGTQESEYMRYQQDAIKQRNEVGRPLDFDVDFVVDNLLQTEAGWKIFVSDKIGGRYFLQDYLIENKEKIMSGEIPDNMLHPDSFDPNTDTRLHKYFANRIKKSFDQNYKSIEELTQNEELKTRKPTFNEEVSHENLIANAKQTGASIEQVTKTSSNVPPVNRNAKQIVDDLIQNQVNKSQNA
jgi:hypothetical protein